VYSYSEIFCYNTISTNNIFIYSVNIDILRTYLSIISNVSHINLHTLNIHFIKFYQIFL